MSKYVTDRMRKALDDPNVRFRLVDAWVLYQRKQTLLAEREIRLAAHRTKQKNTQPAPTVEGTS